MTPRGHQYRCIPLISIHRISIHLLSIQLILIPLICAVCTLPSFAKAQSAEEQLASASALFDTMKYEQAAQTLDAFLAKNGSHPKAGVAAFVLGRCRFQLKQYPAAIAAYTRAIESKDTSIATESQLGLGEAAMQAAKYDTAASALQSALKSPLKPEQAVVVYYWLGEADYNLKRFKEARDAYDHVVNDYPKSELVARALYGSALSASQSDDYEAATQRLRSLIEKYRDSKDRPRAMLLLAQLEQGRKKTQDARRDFEAALNDNGVKQNQELRADAEDGLIQCLLELKDYQKAAPLLEAALARLPTADPQKYRAAQTLGNCRYQTKEYEKAITAYQIASESKEPTVAAQGLYWMGNAQLGASKFADSAKSFHALVERYPKDRLASKAALKAADALAQAKQIKEATVAYQAVVDKFPTSPEATEARQSLASLAGSLADPVQILAAVKNATPSDRNPVLIRVARIYLSQKTIAEATKVLNEALKNNPSPEVGAEANYLLALGYDFDKKSDLAVASLAQALNLAPRATWALNANTRLAELYLNLKQPEKAEKTANSALELKPDGNTEQSIRLTLIQALVEQKKWDEAFNTSQTLLNNSPTPDNAANALYTQAWIREQQNRPQDALPIWERLAKEYPKNEFTAEALLHLGDSQLKAEKYAEAQERYDQLISSFPMSDLIPEARYKRGSALFNAGKTEEALTDFKAVAEDKNAGDLQPEALYWTGVALDKSGKKEEALDRLTSLVNKYPSHARVANAKIRIAALKATLGK